MRSRTDRFTGIFSDDGTEISGEWEQFVDGGEWRPWMEVTLTKQPPSEAGRLRNGRVATRLPAQDLERAARNSRRKLSDAGDAAAASSGLN